MEKWLDEGDIVEGKFNWEARDREHMTLVSQRGRNMNSSPYIGCEEWEGTWRTTLVL